MQTFQNQKVICIHKPTIANKEKYLKVKIDDINKAMQQLNNSAFKLWIYLSSNADDFQLALSCVDVCNACGMSPSTSHNAVTELIEKGYLVNTIGNIYDFNGQPAIPSIGTSTLYEPVEKQTTFIF